jgi:Rrf2 family protein
VLSQTVEYALRAVLYLAGEAPRSVRLREIADATEAPPRYLAKILSQLTRAEYLVSLRGPNGGYSLPSRGRNASLAAIVAVFDPPVPRRCLLGAHACGDNPGCLVHERWAPIANSRTAFLTTTTVGELVSRSHSPRPTCPPAPVS